MLRKLTTGVNVTKLLVQSSNFLVCSEQKMPFSFNNQTVAYFTRAQSRLGAYLGAKLTPLT